MTERSCGDPPWGTLSWEDESTESKWHENGKVRGWDGFITARVNLVPYG